MSEPQAPKKPAARAGRSFELPEHLKSYKGVWVFVEHDRGAVHPVSWELIGEGRKLADTLNAQVAGVLLGGPDDPLDRFASEAFGFGADLCYMIRDPVLKGYRNEPYTRGLTRLVNEHQPEIVLLGATSMGRDLAGSVATTLSTGLTADCTELKIDGTSRALAATRPTFGGSLLCTIMTLAYRPQMATVRPRVMSMPRADAGRTGLIVESSLGLLETDVVTKLIDFIADADSDANHLAYADVVVSGGKGLKNPENFRLVRELARVLGGEVGASRPVVQAGWVEARATGRTDRQDGAAQAVHRGRNLRGDPASRRDGRIGRDRRDQHRSERADLRVRALRDRRQRNAGPAGADRGVPFAPPGARASGRMNRGARGRSR